MQWTEFIFSCIASVPSPLSVAENEFLPLVQHHLTSRLHISSSAALTFISWSAMHAFCSAELR